MPEVRYVKPEPHIAVITLDRPDAANSLSFRVMREELPAAWQQAKDDRDVRVIIFTASGDRYFCTGVDLRDPEMQRTSSQPSSSGPMEMRVTGRQCDVWKPIISAVNGHCIGGGLMFAGDCDIIVASETARFQNTGVSLGILAPVGPVVLARKVPFAPMMRMMLTGRHEYIDAQEAYRIGLVSEVVAPVALMDTSMALARKIAANSPVAVEAAIRALWDTLELPMSEALESSMRRSASLRGHADSIEGPRAWMEKREPRWE
ncbi:MAG: enoyl-CoA hydratase/isomerase family protein [Dehalococcoidia bacterium]